jgi:hypothetical protein
MLTEKRERRRLREDDEPSIAEIAIEATWKRDAGLLLDEFEASLLP